MSVPRHQGAPEGARPLFSSESAAQSFAATLPTRALGKRIEYHRVAESTNELALSAARAGAPHGLVVAADEQTVGRGRRGRSWSAPPAQGLLFSVLVRYEHLPPERLGWMALAAGLAGAEAVEQIADLPATIKWPNDIVIFDFRLPNADLKKQRIENRKSKIENAPPWRKLGGILCEGVAPGKPGSAGFVVVGMGLNVLQDRDSLPSVPKSPPTSIFLETGRKIARTKLLAALLVRLERRFHELQASETFGSLRTTVEGRLAAWWQGRQLVIQATGAEIRGTYEGLDEFGCLKTRSPEGQEHVLADAEIIGVR